MKYHKMAWQCPKCGWYTMVSRYQKREGVRPCRNKNCDFKAIVKIKKVERWVQKTDKQIVSAEPAKG